MMPALMLNIVISKMDIIKITMALNLKSQRKFKINLPDKDDSFNDGSNLPKVSSPQVLSKFESKMKLLEDFGFDKDFKKKTRSSKICMADFLGNGGNKQKFLKMAGCVQAYSKMRDISKAMEVRPDRSLGKPGNPHVMDMNTKRRLIFQDQRKLINYLAPLVKISKSNPNSPRPSSDIEPKSVSDMLLPGINLSKSSPNSPRTSNLLDKLLSLDNKQNKAVYSSFGAAANCDF